MGTWFEKVEICWFSKNQSPRRSNQNSTWSYASINWCHFTKRQHLKGSTRRHLACGRIFGRLSWHFEHAQTRIKDSSNNKRFQHARKFGLSWGCDRSERNQITELQVNLHGHSHQSGEQPIFWGHSVKWRWRINYDDGNVRSKVEIHQLIFFDQNLFQTYRTGNYSNSKDEIKSKALWWPQLKFISFNFWSFVNKKGSSFTTIWWDS